MSDLTGEMIDNRYQLKRVVAAGGMATIYYALDLRLDRPVAVKIMHPHLANDEDFVGRFIREAKAAAALAHPNIVAIQDQGWNEGGVPAVFIVMEYIEGFTLRDVISEQGALGVTESLRYFAPVIAAMSAAHSAGILHRDIKPENILISKDGRVKIADLTYKKDPRDFALWKAAKPGDPSWPTPWGDGRPGWHLECSAMAHAYLGEAFDIHGGGLDLIFPHHENEIAQSESAGWAFANIWMHNAWVTTSGEKMSKSLGNSLQVMEILKKVRGIELRWYLGSAHYRSMLEFSFEALEESAVNFRRIEGFLQRAHKILKKEIEPSISAEFTTSMNNDLAVPQALADISELVRIGNTAITDNDLAALAKSASEVRGALEILGCDPFDPIFASSSSSKNEILDGLISLALEQRNAARARKDFAASDAIRDSLTALGITIEDTPTGSRWTVN